MDSNPLTSFYISDVTTLLRHPPKTSWLAYVTYRNPSSSSYCLKIKRKFKSKQKFFKKLNLVLVLSEN